VLVFATMYLTNVLGGSEAVYFLLLSLILGIWGIWFGGFWSLLSTQIGGMLVAPFLGELLDKQFLINFSTWLEALVPGVIFRTMRLDPKCKRLEDITGYVGAALIACFMNVLATISIYSTYGHLPFGGWKYWVYASTWFVNDALAMLSAVLVFRTLSSRVLKSGLYINGYFFRTKKFKPIKF